MEQSTFYAHLKSIIIHLFPLIATSIISIILIAMGKFILDTHQTGMFIWNLFLAWTSLGFASLAHVLLLDNRGQFLRYSLYILWFLFFPNAPYLITDLLHIVYGYHRPYHDIKFWYDLITYFSFIFNGLIVGFISLKIIHEHLQNKVGKIISWMLVILYLGLTGFAILLGRFIRWNSWEILSNPHQILTESIEIYSECSFRDCIYGTAFSTFFAMMCLLIYIGLLSFSQLSRNIQIINKKNSKI